MKEMNKVHKLSSEALKSIDYFKMPMNLLVTRKGVGEERE